MRRKQAFRGSWLVTIAAAGFVGYVIGSWGASLPRHGELSASQTIALRFPEDSGDDAPTAALPAVAAPATVQLASAMDDAQLLSPEPMLPRPAAAAVATPDAAPRTAALQPSAPPAAPPEAAPAQPAHVAAVALPTQTIQAKAIAVARKRAERPGYMLNDAQIASIRERLHMTPDQERMWPAVEAALRNLAYTKARDARTHGATGYQLASADTNSLQVQDLKSAAIPLLMSFNSEQKDEVRNIVHVMGLDQLASQF